MTVLFHDIEVVPTKFSVRWAMPSRWTFEIPPISDFVSRHVRGSRVVVDPFCGRSVVGTHRNDLGMGGIDAEMFCDQLHDSGVIADCVLFDPPYSPRQILECYKKIGRRANMKDTQNAVLYSKVRASLGRLLRPGGMALSFGWSSCGFGKVWPTEEILLVQHGGAHNDTICVAQRRPA